MVTVTSTVPAEPAGATAVTVVSSTTTTPVALFAPNSTTVAPVNPVPDTVTVFPPASGPATGLTAETTGIGTYV